MRSRSPGTQHSAAKALCASRMRRLVREPPIVSPNLLSNAPQDLTDRIFMEKPQQVLQGRDPT